MITILDYGAGNVRSVINAFERLGQKIHLVRDERDIREARRLVFPGVGNFGKIIESLKDKGLFAPLKAYLMENRPFWGICLGLQALFEESEEAEGIKGLGLLRGKVARFKGSLSVPHIGWNGINIVQKSPLFNGLRGDEKFYFVHSYHVCPEDNGVILTYTDYGERFVSGIQKGNIIATQFHPEKSGEAGLRLFKNFISQSDVNTAATYEFKGHLETRLSKRIIACLDVRANDEGDLVVTKGDQYDVREREKGAVRNLGRPVELAKRYYEEGADEITFLNITGFRDFPLKDLPMLEVLRRTSKEVFVPLTIGGGIRDYTDSSGTHYSALKVASEYFRSGADKISIGSDAVFICEEFLSNGCKPSKKSSIEIISKIYGNQAVVISIDPKRVYVDSPRDVQHRVIETAFLGPKKEKYCWYQCTVKGGREGRDIDAITLAKIVEELGAGEILLNCIDKDGTNNGFDIELIREVKDAVSIPVIASSGAGSAGHFLEVFKETDAEAALAAGIFHRKEVGIQEVKQYLAMNGVEVRL